jgi:hypothetical protein
MGAGGCFQTGVSTMKRLALLALSATLFVLAMGPRTVTAQTTCSCPWQVQQGDHTSIDCTWGRSGNENNLRSFAYWACGNRTPCTAVYTHLSCEPSSANPGMWVESGLLNYKCC